MSNLDYAADVQSELPHKRSLCEDAKAYRIGCIENQGFHAPAFGLGSA